MWKRTRAPREMLVRPLFLPEQYIIGCYLLQDGSRMPVMSFLLHSRFGHSKKPSGITTLGVCLGSRFIIYSTTTKSPMTSTGARRWRKWSLEKCYATHAANTWPEHMDLFRRDHHTVTQGERHGLSYPGPCSHNLAPYTLHLHHGSTCSG